MKKIIRSLAILIITVSVIAAGVFVFLDKASTVRAFGELTVDFNVPPGDPIFEVTNMAPGDAPEVRNVDVTNGGSVPRMVAVKGIRTGGVGTDPKLETILDITITENGTPLYGTGSVTGPKTVAQFFTDSSTADGVLLNTIDPSESKIYVFTVTFPSSAGNEFQAKSVIFDLTFGVITSDTVVINEVYYIVDSQHGFDCPKDRGILGVSGNTVNLAITENGAGSVNTIKVNKTQACQILQSNSTNSNASINVKTTTGKNNASFNTNSSTVITTGSASSQVTIVTNGGVNSASACGNMLGRNDEWIELFNPTDHNINLKNWTFTDASGTSVKINGNRIIKAGGYALVAKDNSVWQKWNENPSALKIPLGQQFGDGLDNAGDRIILRNNLNVEIDRMSWGTDTSGFTPPATLPVVPLGSSSERKVPGMDTDTVEDWKVSTPPTP